MYGVTMDGSIRTCIKSNKSIEEMMEYGPISEKVTVITEAIAKEKVSLAADNVAVDESKAGGDAAAAGGSAAAGNAQAITGAGTAPSAELQETWRGIASRLVKSEVKLIIEPGTEATVANVLKTSDTLAAWRGHPGTDYVAILFEPSCANESITAPHIRVPPFQKTQYQKLIGGTLKARASEPDDGLATDFGSIACGDMYITLDGGKHGELNRLY